MFYSWCEELCLISSSRNGSDLSQESRAIFKKLTISAIFDNSTLVYPSVLLNNYDLAPVEHFATTSVNNEFSLIVDSSEPLIRAGLYGRCYGDDSPNLQ